MTGGYGCTSTQEFSIEEGQSSFDIILVQSFLGNIDIEIGNLGVNTSDNFSYNWTSSIGLSATTQDINFTTSDPDATFTVIVTNDDSGCTKSQTFNNCSSPQALDVSMNSFATQPCINGSGSIEGLIIEGGEPPYSISWTGPNEFSSNAQQIFGLTTPGIYTATVSDQCGYSFEASQELICQCDDLDLQFLVDNCYDHHVGLPNDNGSVAFSQLNEPGEYYLEWFHEDEFMASGIVSISENNEMTVIDGTAIIDGLIENGNDSELYYSVNVIDGFGCTGSQSFIIYDEDDFNSDDCNLFPIRSFGRVQDFIPDYTGFPYILNYAEKFYPCHQDPQFVKFTFCPFEPSNPCNGGGKIKASIDGCDEAFDFEVPVYPAFQLFNEDDTRCACLWPQGIIDDPSFLSEINALGLDEYAVLAEFECEGNDEICTPDEWTPPNSGLPELDCTNCAGFCQPVSALPNSCSYDIYCNSNFIDNQEVGFDVCYQEISNDETNKICELKIKCLIDPCYQYTELNTVLTITELGENSSRSKINEWLVYHDIRDDQGQPMQLQASDCTWSGDFCGCDDVADFFNNPCESCLGLTGSNTAVNLISNPGSTLTDSDNKFNIKNDFAVDVSPNPFNNILDIQLYLSEQSEVKIQLINIFGEVQLQNDYSVNKGSNSFELKINQSLISGIYYLYITDEKGNQTVRKVVHFSE